MDEGGFDDPRNVGESPENPDNPDKSETDVMVQHVHGLQRVSEQMLSDGWDEQIRCVSSARRLLANEKQKYIRMLAGHSFSVRSRVEEKLMPGVIPTIKKLLWPWGIEDPTKKTRAEIARRKSSAPYDPQKITRSCLTYGSMHGTIVHTEISHCIEAINNPERAVRELIRKVPSPDPCTVRILETMVLRGWIPVGSEFPIWDSKMNIATAVDMLAIDVGAREFIAIELKTGYENEEYTETEGDPFMLYPCDSLRDCPDNRHQLQLMTTLLILREGYGVEVDGAYVVNTCSKRRGARVIEQSDWCTKEENYGKLYDAVVNRYRQY